ncbi:uncharacterized protein LOC142768488 [Rhipicephalus microplus]|uniref:uncharacterized protein LOC142768488 n=1 Tax=Rhipicephalus microplus TaxID=6941 RepID=UPI003F6B0FC5
MATAGFSYQDMTTADTSMLVITLMLSFIKGSFEVGRWKEDRDPNRLENQALARYVYEHMRPRQSTEEMWVLVTQARTKHAGGKLVNLGFIVYQGVQMLEKCLTTVFAPQGGMPEGRLSITKFWCRRSF